MAAFTFQPHFHLDSLFMSNNNNYIINPIYFPSMQDSSLQIFDNNVQQKIEPSMSDKTTTDNTPTSSIVVDLEGGGDDQVINSQEKTNPSMEKKKRKNGSCLDSDINQSKDRKQRSKPKRQKKCELEVKEEKKIKEDKNKKKRDEAKAAIKDGADYVHVRARRGQASDSHSLAERVRREKISERLKMLQSLVPGCDKVNSKAHMLDEIINYVQSLQVQVEMLSMKLAYMNPILYDFGMDLADGFFCHELQKPITSTLAAATSSPLPLTTAPAPTTTNSTTAPTEIANVVTPTFSSTSNDTTLHENSVLFSTIQQQEVQQQQKLNDFSQVLLQQQQQQELPNNEDLLCYMDYYHQHHHRQEGATNLFFYE
ncbi:hypothetical protein C5167_035051 [Papaver somniferum]|uniref:BHLH domain-containing protein n=1 Tax=Papaver somniferum TaxID=3469 RepID=A0A4Y7KGA4_PAPSO|nr:transcription factor bHLH137-like [Papaver somniferum]RZC71876.1 hypothetical protein C5167_035051 [Papaver somniferum]